MDRISNQLKLLHRSKAVFPQMGEDSWQMKGLHQGKQIWGLRWRSIPAFVSTSPFISPRAAITDDSHLVQSPFRRRCFARLLVVWGKGQLLWRRSLSGARHCLLFAKEPKHRVSLRTFVFTTCRWQWHPLDRKLLTLWLQHSILFIGNYVWCFFKIV